MSVKHPNCTTRAKEGKCDDLYCPIHGRIRNMDAGASPFADPDAIATAAARAAGLSDGDVRRAYAQADDELPSRAEAADMDLARRLRREAAEADARGARDAYQDLKASEKFGPHWDADSTAEEDDDDRA